MRILPCGTTALLLELDDLEAVRGWYETLRHARLPGVVDLVPAARTLLLVTDLRGEQDVGTARPLVPGRPQGQTAPSMTLDGLARALGALQPARSRRPDDDERGVLDVPVVYDGDDLAEVARLLGCDEGEVVRRHTNERWTVAFCGFAPGFGYLVPEGPDAAVWAVPRRARPRTRVPAGSVGLAGPYTGLYPRSSPGGWQLIGRAALDLFDPAREPAALLTPGRQVRFREARHTQPTAIGRRLALPTLGDGAPTSVEQPVLTVVEPGLSTTVQDEGRPGLSGIGVSPSGAADQTSYALANRLVGNRSGAAALEVAAGGLSLRAERDVLVAVTGAPCAGAPQNASVLLREGDELRLGTSARGLLTYVAVRGGVGATPVLGSCSTDLLSGLGPPPLRAGDRVMAGDASGEPPPVSLAPVRPVGVASGEVLVVRVLPGPRLDWFEVRAWQELTGSRYVVTADSNRVGLRLDGPRLGRARADELPSEGLVRGAVQVPTSGLPLLFLADHPTTGGYPVIANVVDEDVDAVAQLRPGDALRFTAATTGGFGTPEARM